MASVSLGFRGDPENEGETEITPRWLLGQRRVSAELDFSDLLCQLHVGFVIIIIVKLRTFCGKDCREGNRNFQSLRKIYLR